MNRQLAALSPRERLHAAVNGLEADRPPVSLWRHFPEQDQTADDLANVTLRWQDQFAFDFIKFMPPGDYPTIDWGAKSRYEGSAGGTRTTSIFPVNGVEDWKRLKPVDVEHGFNKVMLDAVQSTRSRLEADVPLLQTIFGPLTVALKLSNGQAIQHLREYPEIMMEALATITAVTGSMLERSIDRGADGVFFATQCADESIMTGQEYRELALPFDIQVLSKLPSDAFLMVHLHGAKPMLALQDAFPPGVLNWHDRRFGPPLKEIQARTGRCVAGGIDELSIVTDDATTVAASALDAIEQNAGRSVVVTPGCVIPITTPGQSVASAVDAVKAWRQR